MRKLLVTLVFVSCATAGYAGDTKAPSKSEGGFDIGALDKLRDTEGRRAVILFNRGTSDAEINVSWEDLGYPAHLSARVRDLWQAKDLGERKGMFSATVAPHSIVMVTVKP